VLLKSNVKAPATPERAVLLGLNGRSSSGYGLAARASLLATACGLGAPRNPTFHRTSIIAPWWVTARHAPVAAADQVPRA